MNNVKSKKDRSMNLVFAAVSISFLLAIAVSICSLLLLARENTKEIDTMLSYRIYDTISSSLNEPIVVAKTMSCDDFLMDFLKKEDSYSEGDAVNAMQRYLSGVKSGLQYDSAFLVSEKSRRYYTYEGLNKIVDPENDAHDVWYSLFIEKNKPYDLDVDSDEMNQGNWTVFVNARIEDENGRLLGVCGVGVQMTNLQELFLESENKYGVKINLVDKNGLVQVDTQDVNIENAWLEPEVLSPEETDEYVYRTLENGEFTVTKYVEYLGWYLVVRSAPTAISREYVNIILLNIILFLAVMLILIFTVSFILKRARKERDDREKLLIVSERAVAASEAKSSFLSNMSHEIRTPINAVLGMNEMILREAKDENILSYSANIQSAGKTLLSIINSILDFSRIEEGKMEIVPVDYDTASVVNNIVVSVAESAKEKGLSFTAEIDENLPAGMVGDDVRLSQVIMNLLTNAVKYTKEGSVKLTIKEEGREKDRILLYVEVEDTGIGIKDQDLPKLFESFERLDEVKNHGIEGTGLGMSIVTNLLKLMGSEIHVESEYQKGSRFSFTVSQGISDETLMGDYVKRLVNTRRDSAEERIFAQEARVLVVDDNEMNRKVAGNLLSLFGIRPDLCESGEGTLELVKTGFYHIILLDHMMPEMDGIETLSVMRSQNLLDEKTRVIALTANAVNGAKERYLNAGFDDYLSKPIEVDKLEEILKKWLPEEIIKEREELSEEALGNSEENADSGIFEFAPIDEETQDNVKIDSGDSWTEELENAGLNTKTALSYCGGDLGLYRELLSDYVRSFPGKKKEMLSFLEKGDHHGFEVQIHALKSTSKTIGAVQLSKKAYLLEEAAGKGDRATIDRDFPAFLEDYQKLKDAIERATGLKEEE